MTNRIDLDLVRISLYQRRPVPRSDHPVRKAFCRPPRLTRSLPRQPFLRSDSSRCSGGRPRRGNLCCRRILCNQSSGFCSDSQVAIQSRLEFRDESQKRRQSISQRIDQFLADPCTGSTGARKPFGGSVSHSRSGSGPRAVASDLPIPTHFSGFKLLSTDELAPQLPWHFTVCPSGSTERMVTGSFAGNPCV
jgi:hypothetical protein